MYMKDFRWNIVPVVVEIVNAMESCTYRSFIFRLNENSCHMVYALLHW